jgi:hypothetical protein
MPISSKPIDGVPVTVSPPDLDGLTGGNTPFEVTYFINDTITLEAPASVGNYKFHQWIVNGEKRPVGKNPVDAIIVFVGNCSAEALYIAVPQPADPLPQGFKNKPLPEQPSLDLAK